VSGRLASRGLVEGHSHEAVAAEVSRLIDIQTEPFWSTVVVPD